MSKAALWALFAVLVVSAIAAQTSDSSAPASPPGSYGQQVPPAPSGPSQVIANTEIHAVLDTPLSARISKTGDRFTSTITDAVRTGNGMIAIPAGARLEGEVAESEELNSVSALRNKAKLVLRFRDVVLSGGETLPISATLVSVNSTSGSRTSAGDEQGRSGAGLTFGSPLKGLAIGRFPGGGYVLAKKGKEVDLPAQTGVVIRLNQPVSVPATSNSNQPIPR